MAPAVLAFCDGSLARYKIPKAVVFAAALPRNAMSKVVKAELYARYGAPVEAVDATRAGD